jgi:Domain of unknown function (DUF1841)
MQLFNPSQADVRRFFCQTYAKHTGKQILTPLENIAARWLVEHPEYHGDLSDEATAIVRDYPPEGGQSNPFLHLAMHLSISEQVQADLPPGLKMAYGMALAKMGDPHATHHAVMEVLGKVLWDAQRMQLAPDMDAFVEGVRRLA